MVGAKRLECARVYRRSLTGAMGMSWRLGHKRAVGWRAEDTALQMLREVRGSPCHTMRFALRQAFGTVALRFMVSRYDSGSVVWDREP